MSRVFFVIIIALVLTLGSCSKFKYVVVQGSGQISLLNSAKMNEELLNLSTISKEHKRKIRLIGDYKKYFYSYFGKKIEGIYSKTTMLDRKAVSYLVVASKYYEIRAKKDCFWFVGCFPYLGFYNEEMAKDHASMLREDAYETYVRPVYAYSTLGYFEDTILSSFFRYSDYGLAELIFHELFHTIFFVKDEVDLNENLANYFGKEMADEYNKLTQEELKERQGQKRKQDLLRELVVSFAQELNSEYKKQGSKKLTKEKALEIRENKIGSDLIPRAKQICLEQGIESKKCFPLKRKWNNASLAGYLTYEKKMNRVSKLRIDLKMSLNEYYNYIDSKYSEYLNRDIDGSFSKYLFDSKKHNEKNTTD